jgi:hypothetical protein
MRRKNTQNNTKTQNAQNRKKNIQNRKTNIKLVITKSKRHEASNNETTYYTVTHR